VIIISSWKANSFADIKKEYSGLVGNGCFLNQKEQSQWQRIWIHLRI
jgi:hypothetical protein